MTHLTPYPGTPTIDAPRPRRGHEAERATGVPGWRRMAAILFFVAMVVSLLLLVKPTPATGMAGERPAAAPTAPRPAGGAPAESAIAPLFAPEVQRWAPAIARWAEAHGLDPNAVATIMQIESCGDAQAVSSAGARGLFQVMPFHFAAGEDPFDPETNARRGLAYFAERLQQTGGDAGRAFAGYNGGQRAAASSWERWPAETQRYYVWSTGIYEDARNGSAVSATLQEWMEAGGASLCQQAAARLELGR